MNTKHIQHQDIYINCSECPWSNDKKSLVLQHWNREWVLAHVIVTICNHLCVCLPSMCTTTMPPRLRMTFTTDDLTMVPPKWWIREYYFGHTRRYIYDLTGHEGSIPMKFQLRNYLIRYSSSLISIGIDKVSISLSLI